MKVDIRVPMGLPVRETADYIAGCEAAGFSGVGMHDHQHSGRDVFLTLALAAERTSRISLYPATTNPVTRHAMVLASLAHSLEEIAPERIRLTVGPGYLAVGNIGPPRATVDAMRQAILTIRGLLRGEMLQFNGVETRLRKHQRPANDGVHDRRRNRGWWSWPERSPTAQCCWWDCTPGQWRQRGAGLKSERRVPAGASTASRQSSSPRQPCPTTARPPAASAAVVPGGPAVLEISQRFQHGVAAGGGHRPGRRFCP